MRIKSILLTCSILIIGLVAGCTSAQLQTASADAAKLQQGTQEVANATTQPAVGILEELIPGAAPAVGAVKVGLESLVGLFGLTSAGLALLAKKKSDAVTNMTAVANAAADKVLTAHQGIREIFTDALSWKNPAVPWSQAVGDLLNELGLDQPAAS
jgi:hypothetical protein